MDPSEISLSGAEIAALAKAGLKWPPEPIKLTPEDRTTLEALKGYTIYLEAELVKAERAGFDVKRTREDLDKAKALRDGVLREYTA